MTLTTPLSPMAVSDDAGPVAGYLTAAAEYVRLIEALPGFPGLVEWTLEPIDPRGVLFSLRSVDEPGLRFVLTPSRTFFPDYDLSFAAALAGPLRAAEVDVMLVLTVGDSLATATANLRAPIVVSRATGRAMQVVLDDPTLSMRRPLLG